MIHLRGDKQAAGKLWQAQGNTLIKEFRRLTDKTLLAHNATGIKPLDQNRRRVEFVEGEFKGGWAEMQTVFGQETVVVFVPPRVSQRKEEKRPLFSRICPVLKGRTAAGGFAGYFVYLDGYFSSNVLYLPHEHDMETRLSTLPWEPIQMTSGDYRLTSLSFLGFEVGNVRPLENTDSLAYQLATSEIYDWPICTPYLDNVDGYPALEGAPQGIYVGPTEWTDCIDLDNGPRPIMAAWDTDAWCGIITLSTRVGSVVTYTSRHYYKSGGQERTEDIGSCEVAGASLNALNRGLSVNYQANYRRGDSLYALGVGDVATSEGRALRVVLCSPSQMQVLTREELNAVSVDDVTPLVPEGSFNLYHDWCLVERT